MSKIRYLLIQFDKNFPSYDIPKLRAAIIEKIKRESDLFHNHLDDEKFIYRYPLVQYKIKDKKPCILCLAEATEDIHFLLKHKDFNFNISGQKYMMDIEDVRLKYVNIQTWNEDYLYNVHHYIALNQENFQRYKNLSSLRDKLEMLDDLLLKHLQIFAVELEASQPTDLRCSIQRIIGEKYIEYKGVFHLTFSLDFKANMIIPDLIGIGKGASVGFGMVKLKNTNAKK